MSSIKARLWHNMTATSVVLAATMAPSLVFGQITLFVDSLADDSLQASNGTLCTTGAGECTFRAALEAANNRSDKVTIDFATGIPVDAANRSIISPSTPLPEISSQVIIRGETHPNFSASEQLPRFLIDGDESVSFGLLLANGSQDSEVRFIAIYNALQIGIRLDETSGVTLLGNHIGLRPLVNNTSEIQGNGAFGIWVTASNDNTIENNWGIVGWEGGFSRIGDANQGNIIAFNTSGGIYFNETEASSIQANWIGILPDGTPAGNDGPGILVTVVSNGGIGGSKRIGYTAQDTIPAEHVETADAMGNVIAHNIDGVLIQSSQDNFSLNNNPVRGNRFIANSGQAINLGPDGDVIDPGGDAEGPNNLQNFPVFNPDFTFYDADQNLLFYAFSVNTSQFSEAILLTEPVDEIFQDRFEEAEE